MMMIMVIISSSLHNTFFNQSYTCVLHYNNIISYVMLKFFQTYS